MGVWVFSPSDNPKFFMWVVPSPLCAWRLCPRAPHEPTFWGCTSEGEWGDFALAVAAQLQLCYMYSQHAAELPKVPGMIARAKSSGKKGTAKGWFPGSSAVLAGCSPGKTEKPELLPAVRSACSLFPGTKTGTFEGFGRSHVPVAGRWNSKTLERGYI